MIRSPCDNYKDRWPGGRVRRCPMTELVPVKISLFDQGAAPQNHGKFFRFQRFQNM